MKNKERYKIEYYRKKAKKEFCRSLIFWLVMTIIMFITLYSILYYLEKFQNQNYLKNKYNICEVKN